MKEEILKKIDKAIRTEEEGIPIYAKHIDNTLFWSGLISDEVKEVIRNTLKILTDESKRHKQLLLQVKQLVEERY